MIEFGGIGDSFGVSDGEGAFGGGHIQCDGEVIDGAVGKEAADAIEPGSAGLGDGDAEHLWSGGGIFGGRGI